MTRRLSHAAPSAVLAAAIWAAAPTAAAAGLVGSRLAGSGASVSAFGAATLNNNWHQVFGQPHDLSWQDAGLAGVGAAVPLARWGGLDLEVEGQLVRHFGAQNHWEVNAPILTAAWTRWPWSERLPSYAAFGIGPSFASTTPRLEARNNRESSPTLIYWKIELGADLPAEGWSAFWRLHHRSTGYGLMGDAGGANAIGLGLRRRF